MFNLVSPIAKEIGEKLTDLGCRLSVNDRLITIYESPFTKEEILEFFPEEFWSKPCPDCGNKIDSYWAGPHCICRACMRAKRTLGRLSPNRGRKSQNTKCPPIKYLPGEYITDPDGQTYQILAAFRRSVDINEWRFLLEERDHIGDEPISPMSFACEIESRKRGLGSVHGVGKVCETPLRTIYDVNKHCGLTNLYVHGDRKYVTNKTLMQWEPRTQSQHITPPSSDGVTARQLHEGKAPEELVKKYKDWLVTNQKESSKRQAANFLKEN